MRKINYILVGLISILFNINVYASNDIKSIDIDIYVGEDGNARVTETWVADLDEGTEGYKEILNLGYSNITDLEVMMNNQKFTTLNEWDIDASFENKAYKAGINEIDNGVELCFGISKYGRNTYRFSYNISNFVISNQDKDMIYWSLIPENLSDKPEKFFVKIHSDKKFQMSDEVWGYGYQDGYAYVTEEGTIELTSDKFLEDNEYVVVLAEFPLGTFNTSVSVSEDSTYYEELAAEGSFSHKTSIMEYITTILIIVFSILVIFMSIYIVQNQTFGSKKLIFSKKGRKLPKDNLPFRNIPCQGDIYKAYWVSLQYKIIKNKNDFLGALLLKWLRDGVVETIKVNNKRKECSAIKFNGLTTTNNLEKEIYDIMVEASLDGILEQKEFQKWCQVHYTRILGWFDDVIDYETDNLVNENLINKVNRKYYVNDELRKYAIEMKQFKLFLKEFTTMHEKQPIEVKVWRDYLIFAQILGMATSVAKEFKELYPEIIVDNSVDDFIFIHTICYDGVYAASSAKMKAESYSSGGGGMSFGGGGGGSFGGGGSGGFR